MTIYSKVSPERAEITNELISNRNCESDDHENNKTIPEMEIEIEKMMEQVSLEASEAIKKIRKEYEEEIAEIDCIFVKK